MVKRSLQSRTGRAPRPPADAPPHPPQVRTTRVRTARSIVVAGTSLVAVTYGLVRFGYGLQLTQLSAEFSLTPSASGLIASGSFAAYCVAALVARRTIDRRGARTVLQD